MKNILILSVFFFQTILITQAQQHWKEVYSKKYTGVFYDITFSDSLNGYVVGQNGIMFKTVDGGDTWDSLSSGTKQTLCSISFSDKNNGYACGYNGTIIKTCDAGKTWVLQTTQTTDYFKVILARNKNEVFAFGARGRFVKTIDGGKTWQGIKRFTLHDINCVQFVTGKTGYCSSGSYFEDNAELFKTIDSGKTWKKIENSNINLGKVYFTDTINGFAIDCFKKIFKTKDGGRNWQNIYTNQEPAVYLLRSEEHTSELQSQR